jgi:hypothetical protein
MKFRNLTFTVATALTLISNTIAAQAAIPGEHKGPKGVAPVAVCDGAGLSKTVLLQNPEASVIRSWESLCVGIYQGAYIATGDISAWNLANGIRAKYTNTNPTKPDAVLDFTTDLIDPYKYKTREDFDNYWKAIDQQLTQHFTAERAKLKQDKANNGKSEAELNGIIGKKGFETYQRLVEKADIAMRGLGKTFHGFHAIIIGAELLRVGYDESRFNWENFAKESDRIERLLLEKRGAAPEPLNKQYGSATQAVHLAAS